MSTELSFNQETNKNIISKGMIDILSLNFNKCISGYHIINDDPIKEAPWEDINVIILNTSGLRVTSQSNGSHKSGGDLTCFLGCFSNKSTQYTKENLFKISSYRLTSICSEKTPGNINNIIDEINNRKNFTFYSIIVRKDTKKQILYDWYLIPSNLPALNPSSYKWFPKIGKKSIMTGWETNTINGSKMSIIFSMSSQLWIKLNITDEIKKYLISSCLVNRGKKYNYIELYDKYNSKI